MISLRYGLPAFLLLPLIVSGCASGPSGGPQVPGAPNQITMRLDVGDSRNGVNSNYYYAVALDDHPGNDGTLFSGPVAITDGTAVPNRVVGGNWRIAVICQRGQFTMYRRTDPTDPSTNSEQPIPTTALIRRQVGRNSVEFTLDLDARLNDGTYILPRTNGGTAPARFDINFVTTNLVATTETDKKFVDSNGPGRASDTILNELLAGVDARNFFDAEDDVPEVLESLDVTNLHVTVNRTDSAS